MTSVLCSVYVCVFGSLYTFIMGYLPFISFFAPFLSGGPECDE